MQTHQRTLDPTILNTAQSLNFPAGRTRYDVDGLFGPGYFYQVAVVGEAAAAVPAIWVKTYDVDSDETFDFDFFVYPFDSGLPDTNEPTFLGTVVVNGEPYHILVESAFFAGA